LTARLVKVDAYLAKGKKEQAAQEIMVAMHLGLDFDLKDRVPVDLEEIYALLVGAEERIERVNLLGQVERLEATLEK
jgi:flagellin-specific chaperone FliS